LAFLGFPPTRPNIAALQKQDSIPLTPPKIVLIHYFFFAQQDVAFDQ
jgi:hypothetical protein